MSQPNPNTFDDDLLTGIGQIAAYRGESERRTYHLIKKGVLPAYKFGGKWESRKSLIRQHADELAEAALKRVRASATVQEPATK